MSDARMCDICGNFYEITVGKKDGFAFFNTYNGVGGRGYDKIRDCCPDCVKAIQDVMDLRKMTNKEDKND